MFSQDEKNLWEYAIHTFNLLPVELERASETLGRNNLSGLLENISNGLLEKRDFLIPKALRKDSIIAEEMQALIRYNMLHQHNLHRLYLLCNRLLNEATESKPVLPPFRGPEHFKVGDEVMIYNGIITPKSPLEHKWISAMVLFPWDNAPPYCYTNYPWAKDANDCGHGMNAGGDYLIFKREDFYGIRKKLQNGDDPLFTKLIPEDIANEIRHGSVEPTSDEELKQKRPSFIKQMKENVNTFKQTIPVIAKRYGVTI